MVLAVFTMYIDSKYSVVCTALSLPVTWGPDIPELFLLKCFHRLYQPIRDLAV